MHGPIDSVELFYAHAIAIEREAAERYREFEAHFAERGEASLAGLCGNLARMESEHLRALEEASRALELPGVDASAYRWLEAASPEAPARELFYRVADTRALLELALAAELSAQRFFAWVAATTPQAAVKDLAAGMAAEELEHVRWVLNALEYRDPDANWELLLSHRGATGDSPPG